MRKNEYIALTARMEGESTVVKNIGKMRKVSEMELMILCNLAHLACLLKFSELDGEVGIKAEIEADKYVQELRRTFANETNTDGLYRLIQSCTAMLGQERLGKYLVNERNED